YVPFQTIQDRRACNIIRQNYGNYSPYELFKNFNFYIAVAIATIVVLLVITGIIILIKYFIRIHQRQIIRSSAKTFDTPSAPPLPPSYLSIPHHRTE
ncbi:unnamed protein product, partial [Rotaria sp. Silwood1]